MSTATRPATSSPAAGRDGAVLRRLWADRAGVLATVAVVAMAAGGLMHLAGAPDRGDAVWRAAVALLTVNLAGDVVRSLVVERSLGVDTIALVAMAGALALDEVLAGAVIGLMYSGGAALEAAASRRARRELTALLRRAPHTATLARDGHLVDVPVDTVRPGEVVVIRTGAVVPVDGVIAAGEAVVDTSALTGEPLPVTLRAGEDVLSGAANAGVPFEVRADRPAAESAYAALVRLVENAGRERAPFVRTADRYAGIFLPITLAVAGIGWLMSGDPERALAVVVVATPCPLILAAPIAFMSGLSRAARAGVIVKSAAAIEGLGRARTVLFDKTGTLTVGTPDVREVIPLAGVGRGELLRLAASVDQLSAHVLGEALVRAAEDAGLELATPSGVREDAGRGIAGDVGGHRVCVGSRAFLVAEGCNADQVAGTALVQTRGSGEAHVLVGIDGAVAGVIVMADDVRPDAAGIVDRLRAEGVRHVAMASGDRASVAERIGRELGMDRVYADQSAREKLEVVRRVRSDRALAPVVMVGDGVNDAPALALADVGVAMGAAGATISSETADAVITVDRIDRVAAAVHVGRRALHIARQNVLAGMGLSTAAMAVAAAGHLEPVAGALLQECIDLAVILNALRALHG